MRCSGPRAKLTLVKRLDIIEVYRSHGIPYYLKIDVEGVDRLILEELKRFQDRPQYVSIESRRSTSISSTPSWIFSKVSGIRSLKSCSSKQFPAP